MRVESTPLYDLHDRLLGHSIYLVIGDIDVMVAEDWDRSVKRGWDREWKVEAQQDVAKLRHYLPRRSDRGVETWDSPRDRETYVWYFRPCPPDHLETL